MADLELLADEFRKEGYSDQNAEARVGFSDDLRDSLLTYIELRKNRVDQE